MQRIRGHLSFANVISVIALFVALGGASYAAVTLPKNSVGAKQIKKRAVRNKHLNTNAVSASKIQANSISGGKVADGSLGSGDILDNNLTANDLANDSVGSGELGSNSVGTDEVTDGSIGPNDLKENTGLPTVRVAYAIATAALALNTSASYDVLCPTGQQAIGGGARGDTTDSEYTRITSSRPLQTGGGFPTAGGTFQGWRATVVNRGSPGGAFPPAPPDGDIKPEVWAMCIPLPATP